MQRTEFTNHPSLPGFGFGFFEWLRNGVRALTHGGEARGFNSLFCIVPGTRTGFFLSYNRFGSDLAVRYYDGFIDRFFPGSRNAAPAPARTLASVPAPQTRDSESGTFRMNRYPRSDFTKISALLAGMAQEVRLSEQDDGSLRMTPLPWSREPASSWRPVAPLVYQNPISGERLAFRTDSQGRVTHLFRGSRPEGAFDPIAWYESTTLHLFVVAAALLVFALNCYWLRSEKAFAAVGAAYLAFALSGLAVFKVVPPVDIIYGVPALVRAWLVLPAVAEALLVAGLGLAVFRWGATRRKPLVVLQLAAGICFEGVLLYWRFC
jgi:hypothetical protein